MSKLLTIIAVLVSAASFGQSYYSGQGLTRDYGTDTIIGFKSVNTDPAGQSGFTAAVVSDTAWYKCDSTGNATIESTGNFLTVPDTVNFAGTKIYSTSADGDTLKVGNVRAYGAFMASQMAGMTAYFIDASAGDAAINIGEFDAATNKSGTFSIENTKIAMAASGPTSATTYTNFDLGDTLILSHVDFVGGTASYHHIHKDNILTAVSAAGGNPHSNIEYNTTSLYLRRSDGDNDPRSGINLQNDDIQFIAQDNPDSLSMTWDLDGLQMFNENSEVFEVDSSGTITQRESLSTPPNPTAGTEARIYMKSDKFIIQFNDGGTVRYKYLDLSGASSGWSHTTTPP